MKDLRDLQHEARGGDGEDEEHGDKDARVLARRRGLLGREEDGADQAALRRVEAVAWLRT
jgi:hypothetical protein